MRYLMLDRSGRAELLGRLARMADFLERELSSLPAAAGAAEGPDQSFSPVEHCWHLADLEREGFGTRIRRLLEEDGPALPDFDGARIARERRYKTRSLAEGLAAFRGARQANLAALAALDTSQWSRAGTQEGVGTVMLCDLPSMMAEHDQAHRDEIEAWRRSRPQA